MRCCVFNMWNICQGSLFLGTCAKQDNLRWFSSHNSPFLRPDMSLQIYKYVWNNGGMKMLEMLYVFDYTHNLHLGFILLHTCGTNISWVSIKGWLNMISWIRDSASCAPSGVPWMTQTRCWSVSTKKENNINFTQKTESKVRLHCIISIKNYSSYKNIKFWCHEDLKLLYGMFF